MDITEDDLVFEEINHPGGAGVLWEIHLGNGGPVIARVNWGLVSGKLTILDTTDQELFSVIEDREAIINWLIENGKNLLPNQG